MNTTGSHSPAAVGSFVSASAGDAAMLVTSSPVDEPPFYLSRLPAMTFGQLRTLSRSGTPPGATIRQIDGGYVVEFDIGPTRWILISTHSKRPRLFRHVDGAASVIRPIGAQPIRLTLRSDDMLSASEHSSLRKS